MKKILSCILVFLLSSVSLFALDMLQSYTQPLIGYILKSINFSVDIMEEVLPFDLQSSNVNPANGSASSLSGLRIGNYSLESNCDVKLYVAHTKLYLSGRIFGIGDAGTLSAIDYRLYMETDDGLFDSCISSSSLEYSLDAISAATFSGLAQDEVIEISGTGLSQNNVLSYNNKGIFVRLEDALTGTSRTQSTTNAVIDQLKAGTYSSDVVFYLEAEY